MKKVLILPLLFLSCCSFAQQHASWKVIDSLEVIGRVRAADSLVMKVLKTAEKTKDHEEVIKAKLYHYKFYQINHEDSEQYILEDVNRTIADLPSPFDNVFLSYKAAFLNEYLNDHRWTIKERTKIDDPDPHDLETWSAQGLRDSIRSAYDRSLQQEKLLMNTPTGKLSALILPNMLNRKYKPTVYDLLATRAIEYYSNSSNFTTAIDTYPFTSEALYAVSNEFAKLDLNGFSQEIPAVKVLQTFQKLERLHSDLTPQVFAQLERLEYVNTYFRGSNKWQLYDQALEKLSQRYKGQPIQALILYTQAQGYFDRSTETGADGELRFPESRKNAFGLATRIIKEFGNSESAQQAIRLVNTLQSAELSALIPEYLSSDQFGRIRLSYTSLDSVHLKVFKVPQEFEKGIYRNSDSLVLRTARKEPVYEQKHCLPSWDDYNPHSTELVIPKLPIGNYLIFLGRGGAGKEERFNYGFLKISDLALSQTHFDRHTVYRVLDRSTGEPENKVKLSFFNRKDALVTAGYTDENGELRFSKGELSYNGTLRAVKAGDTLISNFWRGYYSSSNMLPAPAAKSLMYLDRAIYRPGQKVYFKGILLERHKNEVRTVPNEYVEVHMEDPNGEEFLELRLKTNKYGSFSGEFTLPSAGITGEFRIYTSEDNTAGTAFWDRITDDGNYHPTSTYFSVEEYKRPSFEVAFDPIDGDFNLNDTVRISGKAESFMGAPVGNRNVQFTVERHKMVRYWWRARFEEAVTIMTDSVSTDENGNFMIRFPALADPEDLKDENLTYRYTISAEVTDLAGETREGTTSLKLGNRNLQVKLQLPQSIQPGDTLQPSILATNLNDEPVPVTGELKVYKLQSPDRILSERWWEAPEIQQIPRADFERMYPEEPYASARSPEDWPKGALVYQQKFEAEGSFNPVIGTTSEWDAGKYLIEVTVSGENNTTSTQKTFDLFDTQDPYLPDNQRINISLLNEDFRKDGKIELLLQTAYKNLYLHIGAYDGYKVLLDRQLLVDGRKVLEIPIPDGSSETVKIQVSGIKNNAAFQETLQAHLASENLNLWIETQTFRKKIAPGQEETWSFTISDEAGSIPDAEVLASMYDASLDQFKTANWEIAHHLERRASYPDITLLTDRESTWLKNSFPYQRGLHDMPRLFDRLSLFGFNFGQPNSYQYRLYLSRKKAGKFSKALTGNTRGRITDEKGNPLPGVNVLILGGATGTQANFHGEFALDTEPGDVLQFSFLGFVTKEVYIENEKELYIVLEENTEALEEVVTVGYAVDENEEAEMISEVPSHQKRHAAALLQGMVPGVQFSVPPVPGQGNLITIRGANTGVGDTPLYIVDGEIVTNYQLNEEDLLDVQILEGTKATALYGTRGAHGVVIITTKKGMEGLQQVEARTNLDETAFFFPHLTLDPQGKLQFSFTSPEALTRWKFRLLAHTTSWVTGKYQNTVITQKDLNVSPNPPRFLREGDEVIFKAQITNLSGSTLSGNAVLQLFDALSMEPIDSLLGNDDPLRNFNIAASKNGVVSWKLKVPQGIQAVTYRILAKSGAFSDGEENLLPVLTNRMLVKESLPFLVRAGETENLTFKNLAENNSESLEHQKFTLEYSSNPAWTALQSLPYLMEFEHECSEQTFSRIYANSLSGHILHANPKIKAVFEQWRNDSLLVSKLEKNETLKSLVLAETPWVRDAESETEKKHRLAQLFDLQKLQREQSENLLKLKRMQYSSGAFPWFAGGDENPFITRHILAGFGHLEKLGVHIEDSEEVVGKAIKYLDQKFIKDEKESQQWDSGADAFYGRLSNLHYLYARSFFLEQYPLPKDAAVIAQKVLEKHGKDWLLRNLYQKGLLAMVQFRFGKEDAAKEILRSLEESAVRSADYGMYWKENISGWSWYRAPIETQALLIEAFSEIEPENQVIEEMKIWLVQNKRTTHWPTTKATTEATYALLMQGADWLQQENEVVVSLGGNLVPEEKMDQGQLEAGTGYFQLNWMGEAVDNSFGQIRIKNENSTPGYGAAYWQYFEDLDKIKTDDEGLLSVEKELYLHSSEDREKSLQKISPATTLETGDLVTVRLVVRATSDMEYIHLKDMRASGFEPTEVLSEYKRQDGTGYYQSTRDAATHFFFDRLNKGTYVLEYTVRANNAGNYSNGITTISSMYAPEFSGHTKGIRVEIKE